MRINRDSKGWERLSEMRQCESQVTVPPFVWHILSPLCGLYAVPLSRTVATDNRRLTASWSGGFPACTVTLYSHLVPPMWRWNSLCVLMGAHHAGDKGKETLWDFVRFLTPSCLTVFRLRCGRTARRASNWRREKRQLAVCLTHESARPQHYNRVSNCALFASAALNPSLARCHRRERSQRARHVPEGREAWCAWHARHEPHQFCSVTSCWQKTWTNPPRF